jgi:hypothetical protein
MSVVSVLVRNMRRADPVLFALTESCALAAASAALCCNACHLRQLLILSGNYSAVHSRLQNATDMPLY